MAEMVGVDECFPCSACRSMVRCFHHQKWPWAGGSVGVYMGHCETCRVVSVVFYGPDEGKRHYARQFARFASPQWKIEGVTNG